MERRCIDALELEAAREVGLQQAGAPGKRLLAQIPELDGQLRGPKDDARQLAAPLECTVVDPLQAHSSATAVSPESSNARGPSFSNPAGKTTVASKVQP